MWCYNKDYFNIAFHFLDSYFKASDDKKDDISELANKEAFEVLMVIQSINITLIDNKEDHNKFNNKILKILDTLRHETFNSIDEILKEINAKSIQ